MVTRGSCAFPRTPISRLAYAVSKSFVVFWGCFYRACSNPSMHRNRSPQLTANADVSIAETSQIPRLANRHIQREKTSGQSECDQESYEIARRFCRQPTPLSPHTSNNYEQIRKPGWNRNQQIRPRQMPGMNPQRQLLQSIKKESSRENIRIIAQAGCGNPNNISPTISAQPQPNRSDVHPSLQKVQPANASLPNGRHRQHQNKKTPANDNQPLRRPKLSLRVFHELHYENALGIVPEGSVGNAPLDLRSMSRRTGIMRPLPSCQENNTRPKPYRPPSSDTK